MISMNKELIIIVYKIYSKHISQSKYNEIVSNILAQSPLKCEKLKEKYIIKELVIPSDKNDIEVIYPVSPLKDTIKYINENVNILNDEDLKNNWKKILRMIKLKNTNK